MIPFERQDDSQPEQTGAHFAVQDANPAARTGETEAPAIDEHLARRVGRSVWELCKTLMVVAVLVAGIRSFVVEAYVIHGQSMEPTFHEDERLLVSKFAPRFESIARGDIVIFQHPTDPGKRLIKRVIGLPGDRVEIRGGTVYVNGDPLEEPYATHYGGSYFPAHVVAPRSYFVLGDNRGVSNDSRIIGDIPEELILGKALLLFYPQLKAF